VSPLDDLLDRIRQRVQLRQSATGGQGVAGGQTVPTAEEVTAAIGRLGEAGRFDARPAATSSRSRVGGVAHRLAAVATARQIAHVLAQVQAFADSCREALELLAARAEGAGAHVHPLLAAQVDAAIDRLADAEPYGPAAFGDLQARVAAIEAIVLEGSRLPSDAPMRPWWTTDAWADHCDGPRREAVALRSNLLGHLAAPVLDVACGRGDLLEALRDARIPASGAETDPRLLARATAAGLLAVRQSPLMAVGRATDGELGSVAALGVIETMGSQGAADLVGLSADKLRPGGRLLVESVDGDGARVWADPGTRRPQDPEWMAWLCRQAGFSEVAVLRASESPAGARPGSYLVAAAGLGLDAPRAERPPERDARPEPPPG
jgi:SAM-dependent methyltransferase